jgi:hypothetical protein
MGAAVLMGVVMVRSGIVRRGIAVVTGTVLALSPAGAGSASATDPAQVDVSEIPVGERSTQGRSTSSSESGEMTRRAGTAQGAARRTARIWEAHQDSAPSDSQRVETADVTQDRVSRRIVAKVTYRQAPTTAANSTVIVALGTWSGGECLPRAAVGAQAASAAAEGAFYDEAGQYAASLGVTRSLYGRVLTLTSAQHPTIGSAEWTCAYAVVSSVSDSPVQYQAFYAENLTTHYVPKLSIDAGAPVQGNYRGKWTKLRLDVHNASGGAAPAVRVRASGKKITVKPAVRDLGSIGPRSTSYGVTFRAKLKGSKLTFAVTSAGGHKVTRRVTIAQKPRPGRYKSLAGRYFWGHQAATHDRGWDNRAVWFLDGKWAYAGFTKNGKRPTCRKAKGPCKRYSYSPRTGKVKLAGAGFKVTTEGFRYKKGTYYPLALPKKNAKLDARLIHQNFTGFCGIYCNTWTEWISLGKDGRFVRSRQTIGSLGPPGLGTVWAGSGPDERGTYQVVAKGRIRFRYASGKTDSHTIGIEHDVRGKPSPAGAGLVIGDVNFYLG